MYDFVGALANLASLILNSYCIILGLQFPHKKRSYLVMSINALFVGANLAVIIRYIEKLLGG